MIAGSSANTLVAANDHAVEKDIASGMVADVAASVLVYAKSPCGSGYFEFAARVSSARVNVPLSSAARAN